MEAAWPRLTRACRVPRRTSYPGKGIGLSYLAPVRGSESEVDLLLLGPDLSAVTRFQVFRSGRPLVEVEAGMFERERDRAFFLHADSEWLRRQQREVLHGLARSRDA